MSSEVLKDDLKKIWPIIEKSPSDSATFDNALELLVMSGYSLPHAMMLMIPEAWKDNSLMDPKRKSFYEYYSALIEPWDGPAAMAFTDGMQIAATLDRNGLRPARYQIGKDNIITIASETGVNPEDNQNIIKKGRVSPGGILAVNTFTGEIINEVQIDEALKDKLPYREWLKEQTVYIESSLDKYEGPGLKKIPKDELSIASKMFLLHKEERTSVIKPLAVESN